MRTFECKKCGTYQGDAGVEGELYIYCVVCNTKNRIPKKKTRRERENEDIKLD